MRRSAVLAVPRALARRRAIGWITAAALLLALTATALAVGDAGIGPAAALRALLGGGDAGDRLVVVGWRLPRAVLALAIGAMLGLAGALFQTVTRNALGSPDVLGFSAGAFTGALLIITAGSASLLGLALGAFAGGLGAAAIVFGIAAWRGVGGFALIITGIAVTAMLGAVNTMIQLRADDLVAHTAAIWGAGSLNGVDGAWVAPCLAVLAVAGAATAALLPALRTHELGDEHAVSLGSRPVLVRLAAMALGVALVAVCTAAVGPVSFVALAAPQIARRVWRSGSIPFAATAATGAALLAGSDLLAMRLLAPTILPTGLVTICLGGVYLAWLLTRPERGRG